MKRKLSLEHIDNIYSSALDGTLEQAYIYTKLEGRNKGVTIVEYNYIKPNPEGVINNLEYNLSDEKKEIFIEGLKLLKKVVKSNKLKEVNIIYNPITNNIKVRIKEKEQ